MDEQAIKSVAALNERMLDIVAEPILNEGFGSIATSKLADLARGFFLKPRPIVVLHRMKDNSTVTIKLRRGILKHTLMTSSNGQDKDLMKSVSVGILLVRAIKEITNLVKEGYIEI